MKAKEEFVNEKQREPKISDLAEATGIPADDILFALDAIQDPMSLHEPINGDGGDPVFMMDQIQDKTVSEERWLTYVSVKETVEGMDERQQTFFLNDFIRPNANRNCKRTWNFASSNFKA